MPRTTGYPRQRRRRSDAGPSRPITGDRPMIDAAGEPTKDAVAAKQIRTNCPMCQHQFILDDSGECPECKTQVTPEGYDWNMTSEKAMEIAAKSGNGGQLVINLWHHGGKVFKLYPVRGPRGHKAILIKAASKSDAASNYVRMPGFVQRGAVTVDDPPEHVLANANYWRRMPQESGKARVRNPPMQKVNLSDDFRSGRVQAKPATQPEEA